MFKEEAFGNCELVERLKGLFVNRLDCYCEQAKRGYMRIEKPLTDAVLIVADCCRMTVSDAGEAPWEDDPALAKTKEELLEKLRTKAAVQGAEKSKAVGGRREA